MDDGYQSTTAARWAAPTTAKQRGAVQHAVDRLLDELAPERAASRADRPLAGSLQRHRSPRGCILQAPSSALTVSWFPNAANDVTYGDLQVVLWRGVVSRPGSAQRSEGAVVARELALRPVETVPNQWGWRAGDGTVYDGDALAAYCLGLLEEQMSGDAGEPLPR